MIRRLLASLSLVVLSAALPAAAQDSERILSFHSDITVNPDASLVVRETIRVRARGQDIRRGIFRDFPTRYRDKSGVRTVGFELLEVQRDGQTEPYHTEQLANGGAAPPSARNLAFASLACWGLALIAGRLTAYPYLIEY